LARQAVFTVAEGDLRFYKIDNGWGKRRRRANRGRERRQCSEPTRAKQRPVTRLESALDPVVDPEPKDQLECLVPILVGDGIVDRLSDRGLELSGLGQLLQQELP